VSRGRARARQATWWGNEGESKASWGLVFMGAGAARPTGVTTGGERRRTGREPSLRLLGGSAHVRGDWQQTVELESVSRCSHLGRLFGFCLDQVSASAQRSKSESGSRAV
jgi:hypothetical protein